MRPSTALAIRSGLVALALAFVVVRAHAESPTQFWAHQERASSLAPFSHRPLASGGHSAILAEAGRFRGGGNPTGFRGPYCKAFTNFILRRLGFHPGPSLRAIDALRDGVRVSMPMPGDLAVMRSHVTFFDGWLGRGSFIGLGGNQQHGHVATSQFSARMVVAFVRPR